MNYRRLLILISAGLLFCTTGLAASPDDCRNPFSHNNDYPPKVLRQIAKKCPQPAIANLYYNRAYHAELLGQFRVINRLQTQQPSHDLTHYHSQRMLIALAEAFARRAWEHGDRTVIDQLNRQYDRAIELAEYQLKGNDVLAAHTLAQHPNP